MHRQLLCGGNNGNVIVRHLPPTGGLHALRCETHQPAAPALQTAALAADGTVRAVRLITPANINLNANSNRRTITSSPAALQFIERLPLVGDKR
jgi:hypothetical protein